ncbi:NACHT, LRR and PYD domains-containing protein 3 [Danio rerio]|uniref:NACHT, LRR and PYD domains-containing protein 3 n=2 Tax=Danio rerio TaxID=7955 RepID=A0A8M1RJ47_DANRE|nr:NACHT, LRR and PYD domains-containing protein 12 [Danio rerio]XP_017206927.1 NACHT, LRR and PYD domains-containing protein 12 [Danio rerio]|eukprot:XP_003200157.2 NACHT, LRR and PYD domains-containing protein 12 [Danio rerio]
MMSAEKSDDAPATGSSPEDLQAEQHEQKKSDSSTVSHVSMKSGRSITPPLDFRKDEQGNTERAKQERAESSTASHLSMKSDRSITPPLDFISGEQKQTERKSVDDHAVSTSADRVCQRHHRALDVFCQTDNIHICCICVEEEHQGHRKTYTAKLNVPDSQSMLLHIMEKMRSEDFNTFKRELSEDYAGCLGAQSEELSVSEAAENIMRSFGGEAALRLILHFQTKANPLKKITDANKTKLKNKCQNINEGNSSYGKQSLLMEVYTDLYFTEGGSGEINNEHEVLRNEMISQSRTTQEVLYACDEIFKTLPGQRTQVRTVLTMGIAGIGKHVSVQKFILDWAEGKANQDIEIIIHLPFRDLSCREESCSLLQLVHQYSPELREADLQHLKVLFILDGLELCQYPLHFHKNVYCADINEKVPVDALLTNLIKGNLLPSALLWITTRPSTAGRIPPECVHRVTEIRGFSDDQKDSYFRKKISDQTLADEIIRHIKSCQSLYIMCHMPIFCWISATVLENIMREGQSEELPRTLTGMFTHFLLLQVSLKHKKFNGADGDNPKKLSEFDQTFILKLGELAFQQMEKGDLIFREEDLREGGIDVSKVSEYSVCTEFFREELGLYREKLYGFLHVSYQEFLAAIYAHFTCVNDGRNVFLKDESRSSVDLCDVHQTAVEKALQSENGHLDLFLRFLLGLSVDSNFNLLQDLLKDTSCKPRVDTSSTVSFIKEKVKLEQSPERIINLFHCLNQLNDNSLVEEIKAAMKSGTLLGSELDPEQWSALAYVYLTSGEEIEEFDMIKSNQLRLLPVLRICKKARLNCCNLSFASCGLVASALKSVNSPLTELDLSNCKLNIFGMNTLLDGLKSPHSKVKKLRLAGCFFPSETCANLALALKSVNSQVTELDLSYNKITDGVHKFCAGLTSQNCKLQKLVLKRCGLTKASCAHLASVLKSNTHLMELELKGNDLQDSGVELLSTGLMDPQCRLEKLGLSGCMITKVGCNSLASALTSNADCMSELDLTYNHPGDSGVKLLTAKKEDPNCKLEKLHVKKRGECRMKPGLRKYACQLTVDPNTIHPRLIVSNDNRTISETTEHQKYPVHPDRYTLYPQAMCREPLADRSYFEVKCTGGVSIGVAYKTSDRTEDLMGFNNTFPSLMCLNGRIKLWQNNDVIHYELPVFAQSSRVGVYVDQYQGSLSYYSICKDTLIHLHTHHTEFTSPLYIGFLFMPDSSVTLLDDSL